MKDYEKPSLPELYEIAKKYKKSINSTEPVEKYLFIANHLHKQDYDLKWFKEHHQTLSS